MKKVVKFLLIAVLFLGITGCVENSEVSSNGGENKTKEIATFKINEDIFVKNEEGEIRFKVLSVKETAERNQFYDKDVDRVIVIEYEYENKSREDDIMISELNFKIYDKNNNALDSYPIYTTYPSAISTGRKTKADVAYALNNDENYIEIEFYDNMFNSKPDAKIILEW